MTERLREHLRNLAETCRYLVVSAVPPGRFVVKVDYAPVLDFRASAEVPTGFRFYAALWHRCGPTCTWGQDDRAPCPSDHRYAFFAHGEDIVQTLAMFKDRLAQFMEDDHATPHDGLRDRGPHPDAPGEDQGGHPAGGGPRSD